jgi:adenylate cyclase
MSLFKELKRRNVLRVGAAYVVVAWLIIQVVETIFPAFGFGDAAVRIATIFLAIGLVPTLVVAWAFELTPEGLRREKDVDPSQSIAPRTSKKLDSLIMVVLALALSYFAFDKFVLSESIDVVINKSGRLEDTSETLLSSHGEKSIAVLPFRNLSDDKEQRYFSDGLTEDIITALSRTDLFVLGFSSSLDKFSDLAISEIGENLGVRYLLKGSVRRDAKQIRISGQLFDTKSGKQLWGDSYTRDLTALNIFALQDDITARVVATIADASGIIDRVGMEELKHKPTNELAAYDCVLRSYNYEALHTAEAHLKARDCIERAVELDPTYAEALAAAAYLYREEHFHGFNQRPDALQKAMASARKAIELDPFNQSAYYALAFIYFDSGESKLDEFFVAAKRVVELNPNNSRVIGGIGALMAFAGEWTQGIDLLERTMTINPYSHMRGWLHFAKATDYFQKGEYEASSAEINNAPFQFPAAQINRIAISAELGRKQKAVSELKEALSGNPLFLDDAAKQLEHFYPGDEILHDLFLESLEKTASWVE